MARWIWWALGPGRLAAALDTALALAIVVALTTWMNWPRPAVPQMVGRNCGAAYQYENEPVYDPDDGERCIWDSYVRCTDATFTFTSSNIDVGDIMAITTRPRNGACAVTESDKGGAAASPDWTELVMTRSCAGMRQQTDALLIEGCGDAGDISLPHRPAAQLGHVCGFVPGGGSPYISDVDKSSPAAIEACFWHAYMQCSRPTTLVYRTSVASGAYARHALTHTLVAQLVSGVCQLTDMETLYQYGEVRDDFIQRYALYVCARLTRPSNGGLVAQGCGTEGDMAIPA